jgi:hypothetical protein
VPPILTTAKVATTNQKPLRTFSTDCGAAWFGLAWSQSPHSTLAETATVSHSLFVFLGHAQWTWLVWDGIGCSRVL